MSITRVCIFCWVFICNSSIAQDRILRGHVLDENSNRHIKGATVYIVGGDKEDATTESGQYELDLNIGNGRLYKDYIKLYVSHKSYGSHIITVAPIPSDWSYDIKINRNNLIAITGSVKDKDTNDPVKDIKVRLLSQEVEGLLNGPLIGISDDNGNFHFLIDKSVIGNNRYVKIQFSDPETRCYKFKEDTVDVRSDIKVTLQNTCKKIEPRTPKDYEVKFSGGTYLMGDRFGRKNNNPARLGEKPVHKVTIDSFYIAKYEVSNREFLSFLNSINDKVTIRKGEIVEYNGVDILDIKCSKCDVDVSRILFNGDEFYIPAGLENHPVILISWYGAVHYCNWLSINKNLTPAYLIDGKRVHCDFESNGYRLPTEAEWEFAARSGGRDIQFSWGNEFNPEANIAGEELYRSIGSSKKISYWKKYDDSYLTTAPVNKFEQGDFGICNITGNVWEWCWDWFDDSYYDQINNSNNPRGAKEGKFRSIRGASWRSGLGTQRVSKRFFAKPNRFSSSVGFRMVRTI